MNDEPLADAAPDQAPDAAPESADAPLTGAEVALASLTVKRAGVETEDRFPFASPAIAGRFDPEVGPIDIDLGGLPEGAYVSRRHAKFAFADGKWTVEDLGSSNGTFVLRGDFERTDGATELADGDEVALGNARFVFRIG